jgi:crotonobetainyl-CoA:carnitine CoA-transferase CaiB-like acyl-CoA transferase
MNRPDLASDPRFASSALRRTNGGLLRQIVGEWVTSRFASVEAALAVLTEARIPCAPVLRPDQLIAEPHLAVRGFFPAVPHPVRGNVRVTASPYHIDGEAVHPRGPAAYRIGEHTRAVLERLLGYSGDQIDELSSSGIIQAP